MKNLKLMTAVVALAFLSLSFTNTTDTKKQLHEQIVKLIGNSTDIFGQDINVVTEITLTVNEKSEIVVVSVKSDNNSLVDNFVKSKLNYKKVNVKVLNPGELYRVPLVIQSS